MEGARDIGITAAVGCATGFLWSALSGKADLATANGFGRASYGCLGSAMNGAALYGGTRFIAAQVGRDDPELGRKAATAWFGAQTAASFTNMLGANRHWKAEPGFNAVALPLNYLAAPLLSTTGLLLGGFGWAIEGFESKIQIRGGSLNFNQQSLGGSAAQLGAVGFATPKNPWHERHHMILASIAGDFGLSGLLLLDGLRLTLVERSFRHDDWIHEAWANDFEERIFQALREEEQRKAQEQFPGLPVQEGSLRFHGNGTVAHLTLSDASRIGTDIFPRGSELFFNMDGSLDQINLLEPQKIQGYSCQLGPVTFHPNGRIQSFGLAEKQVIDKVELSENTTVTLDLEGRLLQYFP